MEGSGGVVAHQGGDTRASTSGESAPDETAGPSGVIGLARAGSDAAGQSSGRRGRDSVFLSCELSESLVAFFFFFRGACASAREELRRRRSGPPPRSRAQRAAAAGGRQPSTGKTRFFCFFFLRIGEVSSIEMRSMSWARSARPTTSGERWKSRTEAIRPIAGVGEAAPQSRGGRERGACCLHRRPLGDGGGGGDLGTGQATPPPGRRAIFFFFSISGGSNGRRHAPRPVRHVHGDARDRSSRSARGVLPFGGSAAVFLVGGWW